MKLRAAFVALFLLAGLAVGAPSASANTAGFTDTRNESSVNDGRGDIDWVGATYSANGNVGLGMTTVVQDAPPPPPPALALVAVPGVAGAQTSEEQSAEAAFVAKINALRAGKGLPELEVHPNLVDKARGWAATMASAGRIWHSNLADGITADWQKLGENVGTGGSVDGLHNAFMASPKHYENLVDPEFDYVGIGVVVVDGTIFVSENFMKLMPPPPPQPPARPAAVATPRALAPAPTTTTTPKPAPVPKPTPKPAPAPAPAHTPPPAPTPPPVPAPAPVASPEPVAPMPRPPSPAPSFPLPEPWLLLASVLRRRPRFDG